MTDPTRRFSGRVENYVKYRPGYPPRLLGLLESECNLTASSIVADVGSGTGTLSELFLRGGARVYGVEPNTAMREAGERRLADQTRFTSVAGTAEATTLGETSVDLVAAGQAFHWFDPGPTRREFERILMPDGFVVLVWNTRRRSGTPFLTAYERLLRKHGTDYEQVGHGQSGSAEEVRAFFAPGTFETAVFDNAQSLDLEGLKGRLLSSSYVPAEGEIGADGMLQDTERLFREHQKHGSILVEYDTKVYYGRLDA